MHRKNSRKHYLENQTLENSLFNPKKSKQKENQAPQPPLSIDELKDFLNSDIKFSALAEKLNSQPGKLRTNIKRIINIILKNKNDFSQEIVDWANTLFDYIKVSRNPKFLQILKIFRLLGCDKILSTICFDYESNNSISKKKLQEIFNTLQEDLKNVELTHLNKSLKSINLPPVHSLPKSVNQHQNINVNNFSTQNNKYQSNNSQDLQSVDSEALKNERIITAYLTELWELENIIGKLKFTLEESIIDLKKSQYENHPELSEISRQLSQQIQTSMNFLEFSNRCLDDIKEINPIVIDKTIDNQKIQDTAIIKTLNIMHVGINQIIEDLKRVIQDNHHLFQFIYNKKREINSRSLNISSYSQNPYSFHYPSNSNEQNNYYPHVYYYPKK